MSDSKFGRGTLGAGFGFIFSGVYDAICFTGKARRGVWSLVAYYLALKVADYQTLRTLEAVEGETPTITVLLDQSQHLEKMRELAGLLREAGYLVVDDSLLERGRLKLQPPEDWRDRDPFPYPPTEQDGASSGPDSRLMRGVES